MPQPVQDASNNIVKSKAILRFILFSSFSLYPAHGIGQSPQSAL